jgi:tRNA-2-methylthio-N6-dimethylallyladenosine synthase
MNKSDSERVRTVIEGMGYQWTDEEGEANLLGIIACSVRQKSIDKVYSRIARWNELKSKRNLLTFVSGCILPADRQKFLRLFDLVFNISELPELPDMIRQYGVVTRHLPVMKPAEAIREFWMLRPTYVSEFEAYIPIQNGCDKFCTFCAVPYTRGREISRSSVEILDELDNQKDTTNPARQNVNSYGLDKHGRNEFFANVEALGNTADGPAQLVLHISASTDMRDEVLRSLPDQMFAKQIHLPFSHDDKVPSG